MNTISAPNIQNMDKLFEIYKTLPERDNSIITIELFYEFMQKESIERKIFLDTHCSYSSMKIESIDILKVRFNI